MKICFLMYPWENIEPETDTTLRLIHETALRGHTVAVTTASNLTMRDSVTSAFCRVLKKEKKISSNIPGFYRKAEFKKKLLPLSGFDSIIMRDNPPLDGMMINFLDSLYDDTFIMNDIHGLRIANNKLYTSSLDDPSNTFVPKTHVSKNMEYLENILLESDAEKMIMKPLNGYGGQGVIVMERSAKLSFRSLLNFYIGEGAASNYVILQEYVEGAEEGDVRVLMLNGEPVGAMKRVPDVGDVRSNVHAGGIARKHNLTKQELKLCKYVGPKLVRDGLYFVGLDIINGKLIEVNVLSPGGITRINKLNRVCLQRQVIDFVEGVINAKEFVMQRKNEFKKVIEDAENI